jgi:hypothetical protein
MTLMISLRNLLMKSSRFGLPSSHGFWNHCIDPFRFILFSASDMFNTFAGESRSIN